MRSVDFAPADLIGFGSAALAAVGVPQAHAQLTSRSLVAADSRGISSHGLLRLPLYIEAIRAGGINATPTLTWSAGSAAVAVLDADGALGQVAMSAAVDRVAALASQSGVGAVAVQNSTHYGAGAYWSDRLVAEGMIGIVTSTTGPTVTPFGGSQKLLGTNPLTVAAPSVGAVPLTLDMATSNGAYGKVVAARNEGTEIPAGWAVDKDGRPTVDPAAALAGALLPFGGVKGSGLAVLLEALSASLTEAAFAFETEDIWVNRSSRMNTGHLVLALDTAAFTGRDHTERRVAHLQQRIRGSAGPGQSALAPGDAERATAARHEGHVPLAPTTVELLDELAQSLGLTLPAPRPPSDPT
ncbi:malate dehydrogenase (NAD) /L-sulfolactate dehydrogenase [Georgenia soli]|uniref:Malate dehydrogenase (NAD) /L-sulfolactate dehydrogenase n=1 Tax=Georgenia soli TaxID=638953 RepID=A0A2A9EKE3_9MICO|nr:Ldh family oxidoreductase [Georgenia soli]PFG39414.1 malate dehydrogenase (NAD) /L-sulfolactate dehydrogenase [Georgenia soli]